MGSRLPDEGIPNGEIREAAEVPIGGPQLPDAVPPTACRHAGIVNLCACETAGRDRSPKLRPIPLGLRQQKGTDMLETPRATRRMVVAPHHLAAPAGLQVLRTSVSGLVVRHPPEEDGPMIGDLATFVT